MRSLTMITCLVDITALFNEADGFLHHIVWFVRMMFFVQGTFFASVGGSVGFLTGGSLKVPVVVVLTILIVFIVIVVLIHIFIVV